MMKKRIALLIAMMLALAAACAEDFPFEDFTPETTELPESTMEPEATEVPQTTAEPEFTMEPEFTEMPEETVEPDATELPETDGIAQMGSGMIVSMYDYILPFTFETSEGYSFSDEGVVQANFYFESENVVYDFYLQIPDDIQTGDVLTTYNAENWDYADSAIILRTITVNGESYAFASQYESYAYPYGSEYSIQFDSVTRADGMLSVQGSFEAILAPEYALAANAEGQIEVSGSFAFSISLNASADYEFINPHGDRTIRYSM